MSSSHLVQILLPKETGDGKGLWQSGDATEKDRIAVVEVMVEHLERAYWRSSRTVEGRDFPG